MNVLQLVNRVAMLGQNESNPDAELQARYLSMIQVAHDNLYAQVARDLPSRVMITEDVVVTAGVGTLSRTPFIIANVKSSTNYSLQETDILAITQDYPSFPTQIGLPSHYYTSGYRTINTYPKNDTLLSVVYVPDPITLTLTTTEQELFIPKVFHDLFVFGAMFDVSIDERDKGFSIEVQVYKAQYNELRTSFLTWVKANQTRKKLFTRMYLNG